MNRNCLLTIGVATLSVAIFGIAANSAEDADKYDLQVPGGLAFAEFRGYEKWQTISVSRTERAMAVILGNPTMIAAYEAGIPENGEPFPDGAMMAKIHWIPKTSAYPGSPSVPAFQHDVDFMVNDSSRFADGGGSYTHNGPRRWQTRSDPEWQMLAGWVRGERKGTTCS